MKIIELTADKYGEWDEFCLASDDAWWQHTSNWLKLCLDYKPELKSESKYFMVFDDNRLIAICPLMLETNNGNKEFSHTGGYYAPMPALANDLTKKEKEKTLKFIFSHIDDLASQHQVKRAMFTSPVLNKSYIETWDQKINYLVKFGYFDCSSITQVIDLKKSMQELRRDIRHGHDSDIGKSSKILEAEIFCKDNINREVFEKYIDLHAKASGRTTRPMSTFNIQYDFVKQGNAFLVGAKKDGVFVGFSFFSLFKNNVYYGSACNDPDIEKIVAIGHFLQWEAIKWMKEKGCKFYEIGLVNYGVSLAHFPSRKEIEIGRFKRGFGGFAIPVFQGEKYYSKEYFMEIYQVRIRKLADSIEGNYN